MDFARFAPDTAVSHIVECYWFATDSSRTPQATHIIPDGFPEIIFHRGDPYRIQLGKTWELQPRRLLAGQIKKHFFLQSTGASDIVGIKLKPYAVTSMLGTNMEDLTDKVVALASVVGDTLSEVTRCAEQRGDQLQTVAILNEVLKDTTQTPQRNFIIEECIKRIFESHGMVSVSTITEGLGVSERQLERLFKKYIGLSPKFYSRIIRFNQIFKLLSHAKPDWSEVAHLAGYYDQPHFIRNFKAFTGEQPQAYGFDEKNMANFFLRKQG